MRGAAAAIVERRGSKRYIVFMVAGLILAPSTFADDVSSQPTPSVADDAAGASPVFQDDFESGAVDHNAWRITVTKDGSGAESSPEKAVTVIPEGRGHVLAVRVKNNPIRVDLAHSGVRPPMKVRLAPPI